MKTLQKLIEEAKKSLRLNSAGYGFVTEESVMKFEEQFVIPALKAVYVAGAEAHREAMAIQKIFHSPGNGWDLTREAIARITTPSYPLSKKK